MQNFSTNQLYSIQPKSKPRIKVPTRTSVLLTILKHRPHGISLSQLSELIHGQILHSRNSDALTEVRQATTRKQLQRARNYLLSSRSDVSICYCKKRKVWKLSCETSVIGLRDQHPCNYLPSAVRLSLTKSAQ
jgi:hypothetical protein